jgi:hypothetical protein
VITLTLTTTYYRWTYDEDGDPLDIEVVDTETETFDLGDRDDIPLSLYNYSWCWNSSEGANGVNPWLTSTHDEPDHTVESVLSGSVQALSDVHHLAMYPRIPFGYEATPYC